MLLFEFLGDSVLGERVQGVGKLEVLLHLGELLLINVQIIQDFLFI